jgi:hypothetical protein
MVPINFSRRRVHDQSVGQQFGQRLLTEICSKKTLSKVSGFHHQNVLKFEQFFYLKLTLGVNSKTNKLFRKDVLFVNSRQSPSKLPEKQEGIAIPSYLSESINVL